MAKEEAVKSPSQSVKKQAVSFQGLEYTTQNTHTSSLPPINVKALFDGLNYLAT